MEMSPVQPYLIRAFFDWILDNQMTPHLVVQTGLPGVMVPEQHVQDGRIVLNINPQAVRNLDLGNEFIEFNARFGGVPMQVSFPVAAVLAIYARENGQGMNFDLLGQAAGSSPSSRDDTPEAGNEAAATNMNQQKSEQPMQEESDTPAPPRPSSGKPTLRIIK
ncbi:MAG: ClpXP protease specificity-enhancing factor [Gammaproteobacteria bacterium]|nr:MAG: ClpXP protease specificity-enhancing factor [Gammaproteobacteria bacterium]